MQGFRDFNFKFFHGHTSVDADAGQLLVVHHQGDAVTFQILLETIDFVDGKRDEVAVHVCAEQNDRTSQILFARKLENLRRVVAEQQRGVQHTEIGIAFVKTGQNAGSFVQCNDSQLHVGSDCSEVDLAGLLAALQNGVDASINGDFLGTNVSGSKVHRRFLQNFCKN